MHRADILKTARALTTGDRNASYGHPYENLDLMAEMFSAFLSAKYADICLTAEDMAHLMTIAKMARTIAPGFHLDNYIDAACYQAIAGECRCIQTSDDLGYPQEKQE